jgi:hypothetical protein
MAATDAARLNLALRILAKYRSHVVQWELAKLYGGSILDGPFAGMAFVDHGTHGSHVPKQIGCYEHELHPYIEAVVAEGYDEVINVGCAEGYYAVGLALRMPRASIHAFDTDEKARALCLRIAAGNGIADRVRVGGLFAPDHFGRFTGRKAFFLIDIEGGEVDLLGQALPEDLSGHDFIIECHDDPARPVSRRLMAQLEPTHHLELVRHRIPSPELPPMFEPLSDMDRLLAIWEWRAFPTPWLVAASRRRPDGALSRLLRGRQA